MVSPSITYHLNSHTGVALATAVAYVCMVLALKNNYSCRLMTPLIMTDGNSLIVLRYLLVLRCLWLPNFAAWHDSPFSV